MRSAYCHFRKSKCISEEEVTYVLYKLPNYVALGSPDTKDHYLSSLRVIEQMPLGLLIYIKILAFHI